LPLFSVFEHVRDLLMRTGELRACSELDALGASLVAKLNSIRCCRDLLLATDGEEARRVCRQLISEEKKHFEILTRRTGQAFRDF